MTPTGAQAAEATVRALRGDGGARASGPGGGAAAPAPGAAGASAAGRERVSALKRLQAAAQRTALQLPSGLAMPDWVSLGRQLFVVANSSAWWLGDWLIYGESHFPDRYELIVAETNLDYQTLRNYAWVARKYAPEQRRAGLSFQHHAEAASLNEPERGCWLERAEAGRWSRNELRRRLRAERTGPRSPADVLFTLNVLRERQERWLRAAQCAQLQLDEWIVRVLDGAAAPLVP